MRSIAVIGAGYVGLVTGTCFAELGNHVTCIDTNHEKVEGLRRGVLPFYEPGLLELVLRNQHSGRLHFSPSIAEGIQGAECIFIAVGTPMAENGEADLSQVRRASIEIAENLQHPAIVINKSTVPVETGDLVAAIIREHRRCDIDVSVVSNPEFLREGSAINDFMKPDRIVIGVSDSDAAGFMQDLYAPLEAPIVITDVRTAEMIKYTANAFLATKISFINEIANLCDRVGADVKDVVAGAGSDKRIGTAFMNPGLGFGGSCFPKDVSALIHIAASHGVDLKILPSVVAVNDNQIELLLQRISEALGGLEGRRLGLLGLAFKPNTDDIRESPAIRFARRALDKGASVTAHDPVARANAERELGNSVRFVTDCYEALDDVDAAILATDWSEYKQLNFPMIRKLMAGRLFVDARNIYDPKHIADEGLLYMGVGRPNGATSYSLTLALQDA